MIEFDEVAVTVSTGDGDLALLHPTSIVLDEQRVAVIGGNGSGKSTFGRLINGLIEPTAGRVVVNGLDTASDGAAVRRQVGFAFTDPNAQLVMPTCIEDIALSLRRTIKDKEERNARARSILANLGLAERADTTVHALSGGEKQMLALAGVLATDPAILVADEPTTLLDLRNSEIVADRLLGLDQQLILITHHLDLALRCERTIVIDEARIAFDGEPTEAVAFYRDLVSNPHPSNPPA